MQGFMQAQFRHKEGAGRIVPAKAGARREPISARSAIPSQHQQCQTNFYIASSSLHCDAISPVASCLVSPHLALRLIHVCSLRVSPSNSTWPRPLMTKPFIGVSTIRSKHPLVKDHRTCGLGVEFCDLLVPRRAAML
jgi:hypothetical protein